MKQKKVDMVWTGPQKFLGGRTLRRGDSVRLTRANAKLYKALGVAEDAPAQVVPAEAPAPARTPATGGTLEQLRARFEAEKGAAPDRRWGLTRLRAELGIGGRRYQRRDMRAET